MRRFPLVGSELLMTRWHVREWLEKHVSQFLMTNPVWNDGISETRKMANMAAALHLGSHLPNLAFVESIHAFYQTYFSVLSDYTL